MMIAEICSIYHWTYDEYLDSPDWFIDLVCEKYRIDQKRAEKQNNKL